MSGDVSDKKRLISITGGNLTNKHVYLSGHHDFFPKECYGKSNREKGTGKELTLIIEGINEPVKTDIGINGSKGNLHFDHDVPFSKGGSSITAKNVRLLCAKHNLEKSDKIMWLLPFIGVA